jgi:putative membrane protein
VTWQEPPSSSDARTSAEPAKDESVSDDSPAAALPPPEELAEQRPEDVETPWLRLHPLTPLLRGGRVLGIVAVVVFQQLIREAGPTVGGLVLALALPVAAGYGYVSWRVTRYRLAGGDLQVESGVLVRKSRRVPLARLQAVDVVRGPVARALGLAELRLEVVGGGETEAPLAYLDVPAAQALRARLLALSAGASPDSAAADAPPPPEAVLLRVPPGQLVSSLLLGAPIFVGATLLLLTALFAVVAPRALGALAAASIPALLGATSLTLGRLSGEYGFTVADSSDGLRLRHGLFETRSQTIPRGRVQAIRVIEPLLWRPMGWVRVEVDVAGYGGGSSQEQNRTRALVPVAERWLAAYVVARVVDGVDLARLQTNRAPRRARWLSPLSWHNIGVSRDARYAVTSSGVLRRVTDVVPHAKVQSLRLVQGPLQRRLRLASLHLDTAGRYVAGAALHRDVAEAGELLEDLMELSRRARETDARR